MRCNSCMKYYLKCLLKRLKLTQKLLGLLASILVVVLLLVSTTPLIYAENFTLYSSVQSSDQIVRNLISIYQNSPNYDPFNEFEVARVSQYDYRLFYGRDISSGPYNFFQYTLYTSTSGSNYIYTGGSGTDLYLDKRGYMTVGNVENSFSSPEANQYNFQYVLIVFVFFFAIIALFKIFKQKMRFNSQKGWRI